MRRAILLGGLLVFSQLVNAASFDCKKSSSAIEVMICADPEVSQLDSWLGESYQRLTQGLGRDGAATLKKSQRDWLKERNNCLSLSCLRMAYGWRLEQLERLTNPNEVKLSDKNKIEFPVLVESYMLDETSSSLGEYSTLKKTTDPIAWETITKGSFIATYQGAPAFFIYNPYEKPVPWTIELVGSRPFIDRVELSNNVHSEWDWDPVEVLEKQNFNVRKIQCFNEPLVGGNEKYFIKKGSKKAYLIKDFSSGSAGTGISITLLAKPPSWGGCHDEEKSIQTTLPTCEEEQKWDSCVGARTAISGNRYEGEWRDNKPHGRGVEFIQNGDWFVGEYKNGKRHGLGAYHQANGEVTEGEWVDGRSAPSARISSQQSPPVTRENFRPSTWYSSRLQARIRSNIVLIQEVTGNPEAEVVVRTSEDGTIIGRVLSRSSGVLAWDEAVLKAVDKAQVLPRDTNGLVPKTLVFVFRRNP